jgi:hypothetical protein
MLTAIKREGSMATGARGGVLALSTAGLIDSITKAADKLELRMECV